MQDTDTRTHMQDTDTRAHMQDTDTRAHMHDTNTRAHMQDTDTRAHMQDTDTRAHMQDTDTRTHMQDTETRAPYAGHRDVCSVCRTCGTPYVHVGHAHAYALCEPLMDAYSRTRVHDQVRVHMYM